MIPLCKDLIIPILGALSIGVFAELITDRNKLYKINQMNRMNQKGYKRIREFEEMEKSYIFHRKKNGNEQTRKIHEALDAREEELRPKIQAFRQMTMTLKDFKLKEPLR